MIAKFGHEIGDPGQGPGLAAFEFGLARNRIRARRFGWKSIVACAHYQQADGLGKRQAHIGKGGGGALLGAMIASGANNVGNGH